MHRAHWLPGPQVRRRIPLRGAGHRPRHRRSRALARLPGLPPRPRSAWARPTDWHVGLRLPTIAREGPARALGGDIQAHNRLGEGQPLRLHRAAAARHAADRHRCQRQPQAALALPRRAGGRDDKVNALIVGATSTLKVRHERSGRRPQPGHGPRATRDRPAQYGADGLAHAGDGQYWPPRARSAPRSACSACRACRCADTPPPPASSASATAASIGRCWPSPSRRSWPPRAGLAGATMSGRFRPAACATQAGAVSSKS